MLVLGVITVKEESGLMRGAEKRVGHHRATEPVDHCSCVQTPAANLQVVMNGLCGEVQELQMDTLKIEKAS